MVVRCQGIEHVPLIIVSIRIFKSPFTSRLLTPSERAALWPSMHTWYKMYPSVYGFRNWTVWCEHYSASGSDKWIRMLSAFYFCLFLFKFILRRLFTTLQIQIIMNFFTTLSCLGCGTSAPKLPVKPRHGWHSCICFENLKITTVKFGIGFSVGEAKRSSKM